MNVRTLTVAIMVFATIAFTLATPVSAAVLGNSAVPYIAVFSCPYCGDDVNNIVQYVDKDSDVRVVINETTNHVHYYDIWYNVYSCGNCGDIRIEKKRDCHCTYYSTSSACPFV